MKPLPVLALAGLLAASAHARTVPLWDASGNLLLRGLLYASGVPVRDVANWPFKSGGGLLYE